MGKADIGLVGLGVMGRNLALNMDEHGFSVAVYNRTLERVDEFLRSSGQATHILGVHSLEDLTATLKQPRRILLMVKAGQPVDDFIQSLLPYLQEGDILIDGGNSNYQDTMRRTARMESKGLLYVGAGVSGGEEGARHGPSLMPGGSPAAWPRISEIFQAIAAKVMIDGREIPCCDWVGENGAGHFVKMVHNGIEYGDMQLIAEAYHLMKEALGMSADEMQIVFKEWNRGRLDSYLIQITADILGFKDEDGMPLVDKILDAAGQKGTGKWTGISALEMGIPVTMIIEAVLGRSLSALKEERLAAARVLTGPQEKFMGEHRAFLADLHEAVYASKIISYTQGYMLMQAAAREYQWNLNLGGIATMWRGGCIIRSAFLGRIKEAFDNNPKLSNLLLAPYFKDHMQAAQAAWRRVVAQAAELGIPIPAMASALAFYDGYRCGWLPANLLQAQRDYFGAHTYERVDRPRGEFFHTDWTGQGGAAIFTPYMG
jgi:6-phosphogluconate dehydrogenase